MVRSKNSLNKNEMKTKFDMKEWLNILNVNITCFLCLVTTKCCNTLTLKVENIGDNSEIKNLIGDYSYLFDETRIDDIKNGNFIYKHKASKGFISRTSKTSWSVSNCCNLYFNRVRILLIFGNCILNL